MWHFQLDFLNEEEKKHLNPICHIRKPRQRLNLIAKIEKQLHFVDVALFFVYNEEKKNRHNNWVKLFNSFEIQS